MIRDDGPKADFHVTTFALVSVIDICGGKTPFELS